MTTGRVLIVGNPDEVHVGRHLRVAAEDLDLPVDMIDVKAAFGGNRALAKLLWRWDRRPCFLRRFSDHVVAQWRELQPTIVITTGVCPVAADAVGTVRSSGARVVNFLTDDPFNPSHRARWFLRGLPQYDVVFSPRRANLDDLTRAGCRAVRYLPFAYAPDQHFCEAGSPGDSVDVLFVGGADADRVPLLTALINSGLRVALHGGYWDRQAATRAAHRGFAKAGEVRRATADTKVNLILVRRANRDGHVMRSFEAAACGGCLLVEDTEEHRDIFADTVTYFRSADQLVAEARRLIADPELRRCSAEMSHHRISVAGRNTYADRLQTILETACRP